MLETLLKKLEDPKIPLLGPNVKALKFWGLLLPSSLAWKYFYIFLHITVIGFTATEWVDIWFVKNDMNLLLNNLKITLLATVSVSKVRSFLLFQKDWKDIIDYVTKSDVVQRKDENTAKKHVINEYTKHCRKMTVLYWILMYLTVLFVMIQPIYKYAFFETYRARVKNGTEPYIQVVSSWLPFNKNTLSGHLLACVCQSYAAIYGGGWITSFDTTAIGIMVFFKGELELLKIDSSRIFEEDNADVQDDELINRLRDCHKRNMDLIKYCSLFDSCLSPIMLLYVFVCSVMICATAYQLNIETSALQRLITAEYLIFGVSQLFMYCWHSNDVFYVSRNLSSGPYESGWYTQSVAKRQDTSILLDQFKKTIVFNAGPFTQLTVPTFLSILKGAYSYYTLLSHHENQ